jgi:peptidyl-prolyl cis-trans isomerase D
MLESMRRAAQGVVGRAIMTVVMGLIIVSFVIWGVGDMLRGFTSSTVASVGGTKISQSDFRESYQRTLQQYQRRLRQPFTNEQARSIGLDREVLERLVSEAALDETARRLGLGVSEGALRGMITTNPAFQNKDGQFDASIFVSALRENDLTERMFVDELHKTALRQFIIAALTAGVSASASFG